MDVMRCTQRPTVLLCNGKLPIRCFQQSQDADLPTRMLHRFSIADSGIVSAQTQASCNRRTERFGVTWRGAFATTARPRHTAKVLWSSLFLHTPSAPNTTDSRSADNVVPLRKTFMRHDFNGWTAVAKPLTWFLSNFDNGYATVEANDVLIGHPTCATSRYELHFNATDPHWL